MCRCLLTSRLRRPCSELGRLRAVCCNMRLGPLTEAWQVWTTDNLLIHVCRNLPLRNGNCSWRKLDARPSRHLTKAIQTQLTAWSVFTRSAMVRHNGVTGDRGQQRPTSGLVHRTGAAQHFGTLARQAWCRRCYRRDNAVLALGLGERWRRHFPNLRRRTCCKLLKTSSEITHPKHLRGLVKERTKPNHQVVRPPPRLAKGDDCGDTAKKPPRLTSPTDSTATELPKSERMPPNECQQKQEVCM